jgi:hypothetical protein
VPVFLALAIAAVLCGLLHAQTGKTISIRMLDGKTGLPIVPSNFVVRFDHLDTTHNESLRLGDDGTGQVSVPAGATFLSVQGTYDRSMEIYIDCDAGMEKDTRALHWYPISDILTSGVNAPNECFKGKYEDNARAAAKPGEFIFYVRKPNLRESQTD